VIQGSFIHRCAEAERAQGQQGQQTSTYNECLILIRREVVVHSDLGAILPEQVSAKLGLLLFAANLSETTT